MRKAQHARIRRPCQRDAARRDADGSLPYHTEGVYPGRVTCPPALEEDPMKLLTLQRQAPVAPDAAECRLCDAPIAGTLQDHLLAGQPGTTRLEAAICQRCGAGLRRLVEIFGPELCFVVQDHRQAVERLIGGPAARKAIARSQADRADPAPPRTTLERSRQHLTQEADQLAHTERVLRAEADTLARLGGPDVDG